MFEEDDLLFLEDEQNKRGECFPTHDSIPCLVVVVLNKFIQSDVISQYQGLVEMRCINIELSF